MKTYKEQQSVQLNGCWQHTDKYRPTRHSKCTKDLPGVIKSCRQPSARRFPKLWQHGVRVMTKKSRDYATTRCPRCSIFFVISLTRQCRCPSLCVFWKQPTQSLFDINEFAKLIPFSEEHAIIRRRHLLDSTYVFLFSTNSGYKSSSFSEESMS